MSEAVFTDFHQKLRQLNAVSLRVCAWLVLILVPTFWGLDWMVLTDHVYVTLWMRLLCAVSAMTILILRVRREELVIRWANELSLALVVLVGSSINFMCWLDGGYASPYYAGLMLTLVGAGFLFSWPMRLVRIFHGLIYLGFIAAPLHPLARDFSDLTAISSNQFFLLGTICIAYLTQRHRYRMEWERFELMAKLLALATTDSLTNLYNRGHFCEVGQKEILRSQRYRRPVCAIMLDIDHFKNINDSYGHGVGDEVIRTVAHRIRECVRSQDVVGRLGGEEFAVLLPETVLSGECSVVAERLRGSLADHPIETSAGALTVTASLGLAALDSSTYDLMSLLNRADDALYSSKRNGRNQVSVWMGDLAAS